MIATTPALDTNATYHADTSSLSHSMLKVFRQSSALFYGRFVAKTIPDADETPAKRLGSLAHMAILEPKRWHEEIAVRPEGIDRRTKEGKAAWEEFCRSSEGQRIIDRDEFLIAQSIAKAVRENYTCQRLLLCGGPVEKPVYWNDRAYRCKPDKVVLSGLGDPVCVIDLKTCIDPSPLGFQRAMAKFDYHAQAAWYLDGLREVYGLDLSFYFIAVGSTPPFDVAIYEVDQESLAIGRELNARTVEQINDCRASGNWLNEWSKDIRTIELPRWAKNGAYAGD